jgi:hypothetical protein
LEYCSQDDLGTTTCKNHAFRVRIEGDKNALYFYWEESAAALARCLLEEGIESWIEEKEVDHTGTWWVRTEKV